MFNKSVFPLIIVFLVIGAAILIYRKSLEQYGFDWQVLSGGNLFIYLVTAISIHLFNKGLNADSTPAFLRNAYSGILIRLFTLALAAFIYILIAGKNLSKPSLFACMGFYLIYSVVEMYILIKESKRRKHVGN
jgi:hypothetical protein